MEINCINEFRDVDPELLVATYRNVYGIWYRETASIASAIAIANGMASDNYRINANLFRIAIANSFFTRGANRDQFEEWSGVDGKHVRSPVHSIQLKHRLDRLNVARGIRMEINCINEFMESDPSLLVATYRFVSGIWYREVVSIASAIEIANGMASDNYRINADLFRIAIGNSFFTRGANRDQFEEWSALDGKHFRSRVSSIQLKHCLYRINFDRKKYLEGATV